MAPSGREQGGHGVRGLGPAQQVALRLVAARMLHQLQLRAGLHPFGYERAS